MIQTICQWVLVAWLVFSYFCVVKQDIEGREAKEPKGFAGVIVTTIVVLALAAVYWGAGAFNRLLPTLQQ